MRNKPDYYYVQSGVVPIKIINGKVKILLISSRKKKRLILPKGIVEEELGPVESAKKEAWEEAGIEGEVLTDPAGSYNYKKWGGICEVIVFPMIVKKIHDTWPESFRDRYWMDYEEAEKPDKDKNIAQIINNAIKISDNYR